MDCKDCANYKAKEPAFDADAARAYVKQFYEEHPELKEFGFVLSGTGIPEHYCGSTDTGVWLNLYIGESDITVDILYGNHYVKERKRFTDPAAACDVFWKEWCKIRPHVVLDWLNEALPGEGAKEEKTVRISANGKNIFLNEKAVKDLGHFFMLLGNDMVQGRVEAYQKQHPKVEEPARQAMELAKMITSVADKMERENAEEKA